MDGHNMETETGVKKCTIQVIPGYEGFDKGGVENTKETDQSKAGSNSGSAASAHSHISATSASPFQT